MNDISSSFPGKVEINDLLDDAISNAIARRYPGKNPEDALSALSEEETAGVAGGMIPDYEGATIYGRMYPTKDKIPLL